jgi:carboxyl-terminal processing protease
MFVEEGVIVKRESGFGRMPIYEMAHKKGTHPDYPLVILINSSSASASEIVAGALADKRYKRAILVGTRTHGKGSVQGITGLYTDLLGRGGGAQLKYTMAYYHLPSGQRVESRDEMEKLGRKDWGIAPNVDVELRNDELKKMAEVQRDNDVLVKANHNGTGTEFKKYTIKETLASDPQLAVALLVIKSQLIQADMLAQAKAVN